MEAWRSGEIEEGMEVGTLGRHADTGTGTASETTKIPEGSRQQSRNMNYLESTSEQIVT